MSDPEPQGYEAGFLELAAEQLEAQRAQREELDRQIAALEAQRQAVDARIEPLEALLASSASAGADQSQPHRHVSESRLPLLEQPPKQPLPTIGAALMVLHAADGPLHFSVIAQRALDARVWHSNAIKPEDSMKGALNDHLRKTGAAAKFCRVGPGMFELSAANDSGE